MQDRGDKNSFVILVSAQVGFQWSEKTDEWEAGDRPIGDGPSVSTSGVIASAGIGFGWGRW
ncbi:MAG: hypothetical protein QGH20_03155 [Candidatus Latescibacteria bacterium]|nr:hypothetical protein [Candidatus Latescibacterota bacterium]